MDQETHKIICDRIQDVLVEITGRPLTFAQFTSGGTMQVFNSDMDEAQVIGFVTSIRKTLLKDPEFASSSLANLSPQELAPYFVRLCLTHAKRYVLHAFSLFSIIY
jgi:hypothetical protein